MCVGRDNLLGCRGLNPRLLKYLQEVLFFRPCSLLSNVQMREWNVEILYSYRNLCGLDGVRFVERLCVSCFLYAQPLTNTMFYCRKKIILFLRQIANKYEFWAFCS
jgi:hypothetical protein